MLKSYPHFSVFVSYKYTCNILCIVYDISIISLIYKIYENTKRRLGNYSYMGFNGRIIIFSYYIIKL